MGWGVGGEKVRRRCEGRGGCRLVTDLLNESLDECHQTMVDWLMMDVHHRKGG